jgi:hypothetical protein
MFTCMQVRWYIYTLCVCTAHIPHQDLKEYSKISPAHFIFRRRIFFFYLHYASVRSILCVWVYTTYETNESKIIWAYCKGILKKTWSSPLNRPRRLRDGLEVLLYSFFNLGARPGVGGQRHVPVALFAGKRAGTHLTGGWVSHRAGLARHRNSIPRPFGP